MTFEKELQEQTKAILNTAWDTRDGQVIPSTEAVKLSDGAVKVDAAFLYADLARSTELQNDYINEFAAKAMRMYLHGAAAIIREFGGSIRSFDGDRVMGVFVGGQKRNEAVKAAFAINWMVLQVIAPLVKERHEQSKTKTWVPTHGIGIDSGETTIARAGIRNKRNETNHNDLIFVGRAPNIAAKLSALRGPAAGPIVVTKEVYGVLDEAQKKYINGTSQVWGASKTEAIGPHTLTLYRTAYWRSPNA
jgi:class 3 adenylate cyclase